MAAGPAAPQGEDGNVPLAAASPAVPEKYLSCRFIERGIVFQHKRVISPCCVNPATGHFPVFTPFDGSNFSFDAVLDARASIIARHKTGDIAPECRKCPRLEEADWANDMSPYAVDEITMMPFSSCNIRCNYCYTVRENFIPTPLSGAPRVLPVFQSLIERKLLDPNGTVRFSGGEPTLSPEFEPLLDLLTKYGTRCIVYTNATKRSDAIIEALRRDKVELVLGIDAASVGVYKAIKKMNYFEKVWTVVADYCAATPAGAVNRVWAKFVFCVENYNEAEQFVRHAEGARVKYIYYDVDSSRVPGRLRAGRTPLPEIITDHIAVLRHECAKRGIVAEFAQVGMAWLTPERTKRIERGLERLNLADATAAEFVSAPSLEPKPVTAMPVTVTAS
jgi:pyruvate-formate lyase-activating enzyme